MFAMLLCWKMIYIYIYILEKLLENILILSKNAGKTLTESCNNPALELIYLFCKKIVKEMEKIQLYNRL